MKVKVINIKDILKNKNLSLSAKELIEQKEKEELEKRKRSEKREEE